MKRKFEFDQTVKTESLSNILNKDSADPATSILEDWLANEDLQVQKATSEGLFPPREIIDPNFRGFNEGRNNKVKGTYTVYTINSLGDLIKEARKISKKETVELRFLMTASYELLFALEGLPNSFIPPHFAMTGMNQNQARCLTAGIIKINKKGEIESFSNQSGNFRPSWGSLQYFICAFEAILSAEEFKYNAAELVLSQNYSISEAAKTMGIEKSMLSKWVLQVKSERYGMTPKASAGLKFADELDMEKDTITHFKVSLTELKKAINKNFSEVEKKQFKDVNSKLSNRTYTYGENSNYLDVHGKFAVKPANIAKRTGEPLAVIPFNI